MSGGGGMNALMGGQPQGQSISLPGGLDQQSIRGKTYDDPLNRVVPTSDRFAINNPRLGFDQSKVTARSDNAHMPQQLAGLQQAQQRLQMLNNLRQIQMQRAQEMRAMGQQFGGQNYGAGAGGFLQQGASIPPAAQQAAAMMGRQPAFRPPMLPPGIQSLAPIVSPPPGATGPVDPRDRPEGERGNLPFDK